MPIKVVPHAAEWQDAVLAFNDRMAAGGSPWGFYPEFVPDWIPHSEGADVWREYHLAVEDDSTVRAGYALKPQIWRVKGRDEWVTDWQGPFTEGAVNSKYGTLGLRMIRDMLKKYPFLYSLGHGGDDEPLVQLLRSLGWTLHGTPFCLRVLRPYRFLRHNQYLRRSGAKRAVLDTLAYTGLGSMGVRALHAGIAARSGQVGVTYDVTVVESFAAWTDEIWESAAGDYSCVARRDSRMMNRLLPKHGWPGGVRLKITDAGKAIGWAVVHDKKMNGDPRFGDLRVGLVTDVFGPVSAAAGIVRAAHNYLATQGVDLVCSNQAHPSWIAGFRKNGYIVLEDRRLFAISPQFRELLEPFETTIQSLHLTNLDGHGPHGFVADEG